MKVLLINGSPHANGCTYTALREIAETLQKYDIGSEIFHIGTKPVSGCIACMKCKETHRCVFNDAVDTIGARLDEFDAIVLGSPVYYASASGEVTAFLDRLFMTAGADLRFKPGAAIASARRAGTTATIDMLLKYFTITEMPVVSSRYWPMVHGKTPEEVLKDEEGVQIMQVLGRNMAWMLKSIEAGKAAGLTVPAPVNVNYTNFIR